MNENYTDEIKNKFLVESDAYVLSTVLTAIILSSFRGTIKRTGILRWLQRHFKTNAMSGLSYAHDEELHQASNSFMDNTPYKIFIQLLLDGATYHPAPQDIMAMQEIIWNVKPDLIIETDCAEDP